MHTYASIADFSGYLTDGSSSTAGPAILKKLEAASRRVDWYCGRSRFGSGFGPRYGTNRYTPDADCPLELWLDDDLLALTTLSIALAVNQTPGSWIEDTDFYLAPFDRTPKRKIVAGIPSSALVFAPVMRGTSIVGKWGERDERLTATATMGVIADTTTTTVTPSAVTEFSPGQTLWVGTEMLYVRTVGATTLTVDRGANGSTAATHGAAAAIAIARYHPSVVDATLQIAARRWRRRDTNQAQAFGESGFVQAAPDPGELAILRTTLADLRCYQYRYEVAEAGIA
jgi:hypothetical protein